MIFSNHSHFWFYVYTTSTGICDAEYLFDRRRWLLMTQTSFMKYDDFFKTLDSKIKEILFWSSLWIWLKKCLALYILHFLRHIQNSSWTVWIWLKKSRSYSFSISSEVIKTVSVSNFIWNAKTLLLNLLGTRIKHFHIIFFCTNVLLVSLLNNLTIKPEFPVTIRWWPQVHRKWGFLVFFKTFIGGN